MNSSLLRFQPNIPVELSLSDPEPQSLNGIDSSFLYMLADGQIMVLPKAAAESLATLNLRAGERFAVCQRTNPPHWDMWLSPATEKARAKEEAEDLATPLAASIAMAEYEKRHPAKKAPVNQGGWKGGGGPVAPFPEPVNPAPPPKGTGTYGPRPVPTPIAVLKPAKMQYGEAMESFLILAGRAAKKAEVVLGAENGSVRFDSRDIAAFATTCFIDAASKGLLMWTPEVGK